MNRIYRDAVKNMKIIEFSYDGRNRTAEPHCYGISKTGNEVIRAYQTSGSSNSGKDIGWHLFTISKIRFLSVTENSFSSTRPLYSKDDKDMTTIFEQL